MAGYYIPPLFLKGDDMSKKEYINYKGTPFTNEIGSAINTYAQTIHTTFLDWYNDLKELYISIFKWENLPLTIDIDVVERWIMERGAAAFFIDPIMGPMILPYVRQGGLDPYGNPYTIRAYGINGYQIELDPEQYVIIWDNRLRTVATPMLMSYAERLADIDNAIMLNTDAQKMPFLLTAENEGQLTSLKYAYNQIKSGKPVIAQVGQTISNGIGAFKTQADPVFLHLQQLKEYLLNECLSKIGIPNRGRPKTAQLVSEEIAAINGQVIHERNDRLLTRQKGIERINTMFGMYGVNINVDFAKQLYNYGLADVEVATPESGVV